MTTRSQFTSALAELRESSLKLVKASEALLEIARGDKETANEPHLESPSAETASENKPASLADVRTMLAEKSRAGFTAEVRALILAHGADKLSGIDPSEYAQEGTDAHTLCEYKLRTLLGMDAADPTENLDSYNAEMEECADNYAAYVLELLASTKETCPDPVVLVEQRVDFSRHVENGFGTADCIVIADGAMNVVDYKHGKGVEVSAENNPQMMLYALGALEIFDCIYDIDEIRLTIFQPRLGNISVGGMNKAALLEWADGELKERAKLAYEGGGEYACGEWCRFCRAKAVCRNGTEENLKMARYDFAPADTLDENEELAANVVPVVGLSAQIVLCLHSVLRARTALAPRPGKTLHRTVLFSRLRVPFDLTKHRGTRWVPLCLVPVVGLEPTRYCYQRILSPSRLPIPSHRRIC